MKEPSLCSNGGGMPTSQPGPDLLTQPKPASRLGQGGWDGVKDTEGKKGMGNWEGGCGWGAGAGGEEWGRTPRRHNWARRFALHVRSVDFGPRFGLGTR